MKPFLYNLAIASFFYSEHVSAAHPQDEGVTQEERSLEGVVKKEDVQENILRVGSKIGPGRKQNKPVVEVPSNYRFKVASPENSLEEDVTFYVIGAILCSDDKPNCLRPEPNATIPLSLSYNQWYTVESNVSWQRQGVSVLNHYNERNETQHSGEFFMLTRLGFYIFSQDASSEKQYLKIGVPKHNPVIAYVSGVATGLASWFLYKSDTTQRISSSSECE